MHNQKAAKTAMLTELVNIAIRTSNRRPAFNRRLRLLSPPQRRGAGSEDSPRRGTMPS